MTRIMAPLLLAGLLASAVSVSGTAQETPSQKFRLDVSNVTAKTGRVPNGYGSLGLTVEQKQKIYGIQEAYKVRIAELEAELAELKSEESLQIENVLSPPQKSAISKYKEAQAARRTR